MSGFITNGLSLISTPLTGSEQGSFDTQNTQGQMPETVAISTDQLSSYARQSSQGASLFRNLLHGGDFTTNPFQRGASFTSITTTLTYTADRWFAESGASTALSISQQAITALPGFADALQFGRTSGQTGVVKCQLGQVVDPQDVVRTQGQNVILSFYALASAAFLASTGATSQQLGVSIYTGTGTASNSTAANMIAGSWTGSAVSNATTSIVPTTTWTRYYIFASIPAATTELGVLFYYTPLGTAATNEYVQFAGIQLEVVSPKATQALAPNYASAFEYRPQQVELALAQRYYVQFNETASSVAIVGQGMISTTNHEQALFYLPVQMRAAPTVTVAAGTMKWNIAGTATALTSLTAGTALSTVNTIVATDTTTGTVGQATQLVSGNSTGGGYVAGSADF